MRNLNIFLIINHSLSAYLKLVFGCLCVRKRQKKERDIQTEMKRDMILLSLFPKIHH